MNWPRGYTSLLILLLSGFAAIPSRAQMKIGGQAESTRLDAALEISSHKKGLLLPRVTSTALTSNPLDSAAAGMMVFNITDQTLYVKKTNGYTPWYKVPDLTTYALGGLSDINFPIAPSTNQLLQYNGTKWSNWTPDYIKTISGDVTASAVDAAGNVVTTLSNFGIANTYFKVTTDAKGRVQSGATALVAADIPNLATAYIQNQNAALQTGDFRISGNGNMASLSVTGLTAQGGLLFTNTGAVTQKAGQLIWDNTNNRLGIGNAAPSTALHVTGGIRVTGLNTAGGVLFANGTTGDVAQKAAQLIWDNTNDRLGIGLAAPAAKLDVEGTFKLGADGTVLTGITKLIFNTPANQNCGALATTNVTYTLPAGVVLKADDNVMISPGAALASGLAIGWARVSNTSATTPQIMVGYVNSSTATRAVPGNTRLNIAIISL
ncbi:hypothetical protein AAHN97_18850 [Chitinophaga niabensis]|uniref:hypothetical protein n=1 Tax=Chitinophaga niabensis TaxID=536979 RepID=UPI0031BAB52E